MEKSIGALWINTGTNGEYFTGNIELPDGSKQNVIVFKNDNKKDKQPDYRIYKKRQNTEEITSESDLPF